MLGLSLQFRIKGPTGSRPQSCRSGQCWALQVWTYRKHRAGRKNGRSSLSHLLILAKCGRALPLPSGLSSPHALRREGVLTLVHNVVQGDSDSGRLIDLAGASLRASGLPIHNHYVQRFLLPATQLGVLAPAPWAGPDPRSRYPVTYGTGGLVLPTQGVGCKLKVDVKAERGAGAGLSAEQTRLSRSHTLFLRSAGRVTPAALSPPLFSPGPVSRTSRLPLS